MATLSSSFLREGVGFLIFTIVLSAEIETTAANEASAEISSASVWDVGDHFLGVTLDFHSPIESKTAWGNSSVLTLNLENPRFIALASKLAPSLLRLGGGPQDRTVYKMNGFTCDTWFCLTPQRWEDIVRFTQKTGLRLVMGLNAMYGRASKDSLWDPRNAHALLKHTAMKKYPVFAFGYGNELGKKVDAYKYIEGLVQVREWIDKYWPDPSTRPLLVGPDINQDDGHFGSIVLNRAKQHVNAFTWHLYTGFGLDENLGNQMQDIKFYQTMEGYIKTLLGSVKSSLGDTEVWVGESAAAWYRYVVQLGLLARYNHRGFCRQALVGGWYGLLNWTDFTPNPDYWIISLWKQTMGRQVYTVKTEGPWDNWVYVFAHSAPGGGRTVAIVNIKKESRSFHLKGPEVSAELMREEYWLNAPDGVLTRQLHLNGVPMQLTPDDQVPPMIPLVRKGVAKGAPASAKAAEGHWVTIPPQSIVFIRFLDADAIPFRPSSIINHGDVSNLQGEDSGGDVSIIKGEAGTGNMGHHKAHYLQTYGQGVLWVVGLVAFVWCFVKWAQNKEEEAEKKEETNKQV